LAKQERESEERITSLIKVITKMKYKIDVQVPKVDEVEQI